MNLPDVQRGMTIMAEQIQRINSAIKQVAVRPGVGYSVRETNGGTSLLINSALLSRGAEACPFKVSDASITESGTVTLKVQVEQHPVLGTISEDYPNGRYPYGMSSDPDALPFILTLQQAEGWEGIYLNLSVDQYNEIEAASTSITVSAEHEPKNGTSIYQRFLLASVFKKLDSANKLYISEIANACPAVYPRTPPACPFLVEDSSTFEDARISIRSGLVANVLPDGMSFNSTFRLVISTDQDWWVVYCGMVVSNGVIQTAPGNISIFTSSTYLTNTPTYVYYKLAELVTGYNVDGYRYCSWILNSCAIPSVGGGASAKCWFACINASEGENLKVEVTQDQIAGRWPSGMGLGFPAYKLDISASCYIYCKVTYDTTTLQISTVEDAITILQSGSILENGTDFVYILLALVVTGTDPVGIVRIDNVCREPIPTPCNLAWSE